MKLVYLDTMRLSRNPVIRICDDVVPLGVECINKRWGLF